MFIYVFFLSGSFKRKPIQIIGYSVIPHFVFEVYESTWSWFNKNKRQKQHIRLQSRAVI